MAIHSATPSVQRREERLLRERLAAMDGKVDQLVREVAKLAPPAPPQRPPQDPQVAALAKAMADPDYTCQPARYPASPLTMTMRS
jgi:hypothetical protein